MDQKGNTYQLRYNPSEMSLESDPTGVSRIINTNEQPNNLSNNLGSNNFSPSNNKLSNFSPFKNGLNSGVLRLALAALLFILLVGGGTILIFNFAKGSNSSSSSIGPKNIYKQAMPTANIGSLLPNNGSFHNVAINGNLDVHNSLILNPSSTPQNPVTGQMYFASTSNVIRYFNGASWVGLVNYTNITCPKGVGNILGTGTTINTSTGGSCGILSFSNSPNFSGSLTVQGSGGIYLGNSSNKGELVFSDGSTGKTGIINISNLSSNQTYTLPPNGGIICTQNSTNCGLSTTNNTSSSTAGVTSLNSETGAINFLGTANQLTVTPSGQNITLSLPQNINTSANVTFGGLSLGTPLGTGSGGTGLTSYTTGDLIYASGATTLSPLAIGSNAQCLVSTGTAPSWASCSGTSGVTGIGTASYLPVYSGSGNTTTIADSVLSQSGTNLSATGGLSLAGGSLSLGTGATTADNANITFNNSTNTNTLILQAGATSTNALTFTLPTADGSSGQCLSTNGSGVLGFSSCLSGTTGGTGGVSSLNSESGAINLLGTANQLTVTPSGQNITLSLPQNINTSANVTFGNINISGYYSQNGQIIINTNAIRNNTFIGQQAGNTSTTATYNTAVGSATLSNNTSGDWNTALGYQSLYTNTGGYGNTAVGYQSLQYNTNGQYNTAIGQASLYSNTTGYDNTALGYYSLSNNTTGVNNTALGYQSLFNNTTGNNNTALGYDAGNIDSGGVFSTLSNLQTLQL